MAMNVSAWAIRKPIPSIVLFVILTLLGLYSFGRLPITRFPQLTRFAKQCGATIPDWLAERFEDLDDDEDTRKLIAANVAIEQVQTLQAEGVKEFHFYTLNRAELTIAICHALGVKPNQAAA